MQNLMRVLIVLICANLIFMAGLEIQRRTIWNQEAEYLRKMETFMISNEKSATSYDFIQDQLADLDTRVAEINARAKAVQIATLESSLLPAQIRDIRLRLEHVELMLLRGPAATVAPPSIPPPSTPPQ